MRIIHFLNAFFPSIKLKPLLVAREDIRKCSFKFYELQVLLTQQQSNQQNINKPQINVFIRDRGRESEEEIKPAALQIEWWWPCQNLTSTVTIHGSTSQQGLRTTIDGCRFLSLFVLSFG